MIYNLGVVPLPIIKYIGKGETKDEETTVLAENYSIEYSPGTASNGWI